MLYKILFITLVSSISVVFSKTSYLENDNRPLIQDVRLAAEAAGKLLIDYRNSKDLSLKKVVHDNGQMVYQTSANLEASQLICDQLAEKYPDYGLLSHDQMERDSSWHLKDRVWMIQAVDGTRAYANNSDEFHVQIGLLEDNYPKLGVIYYPAKNIWVLAENNKGAWIEKNGKTSRLILKPCPNKVLIQSSSHVLVSSLLQRAGWVADTSVEPCSNSTTRLLKMIDGDASLYISLGSQGQKIRGTVCNYCANAVIAKEVGLSLTTLSGTSINFREPKGLLSDGILLKSTNMPLWIDFK